MLFLAACGGNGGESPEVGAGVETSPSPTSLVATATATRPVTSTEKAASLCAMTPNGQTVGAVTSPELIEISGLAASRGNVGAFWAHNDSGDSARVFAMSMSGESFGTFTLVGADAIDWEDMAIGPGPIEGVDYLYVADIGDNRAERAEIAVYRFQEPPVDLAPEMASRDITAIDKLVLRYPEEAHDAETLLVDPTNGDILIVTKEGGGEALVFRAPRPLEPGTTSTLEQVAEINFATLESSLEIAPDAPPLPLGAGHLPTGGDVSPAGDMIAIRTYSTVWIWARDPGSNLWEAFGAEPCEGPSTLEPQGEAIAFDVEGTGYLTVSEGGNPTLHYFSSQQ